MTNMGAKDALCKIANLGIGLIDTFAYYSPEEFAAGFKKTMAFQPRVIKQNRGSSGEGIWIIKLKSENYCHLAASTVLFILGPIPTVIRTNSVYIYIYVK